MPRFKQASSSSSSSSSTLISPSPKKTATLNSVKVERSPQKRRLATSSSEDDSDSEEQTKTSKNNRAADTTNSMAAASQQQQRKKLKQEVGPAAVPIKAERVVPNEVEKKKKTEKNHEKNNRRQKKMEEKQGEEDEEEDGGEHEEEEGDDRHERASSSNSIAGHQQMNMMPRNMYNFCKYLLDMEAQNKIHLKTKKGNVKFGLLLKDVPDLDPGLDIAAMQTSFGLVYRWATALSEISLVDALKRVMDYVQGDQMLAKVPGFPKVMISPWNIYTMQQGKTPFTAGKKLKERFRNKQDKGVMEAEEEFQRAKRNYVLRFQDFIERNQDQLFHSQIEHIQKRINKLDSEKAAAASSEPKPRKKRTAKKQGQKKQTPFELYLKTVGNKYADLPEEQRIAKLQRRFNKLDEAQKEIFEKLSENYDG